jgi:phenylacetate-coenzyme A ligase PaaK-like adenylate-forming protein
MDKSQWLSSEQLQALQFQQIQLVLRHACKAVSYYRERYHLADADIKQEASPENWAKLLILKKEDIQTAQNVLNSTKVPEQHGKPGVVRTSGSTARPI